MRSRSSASGAVSKSRLGDLPASEPVTDIVSRRLSACDKNQKEYDKRTLDFSRHRHRQCRHLVPELAMKLITFDGNPPLCRAPLPVSSQEDLFRILKYKTYPLKSCAKVISHAGVYSRFFRLVVRRFGSPTVTSTTRRSRCMRFNLLSNNMTSVSSARKSVHIVRPVKMSVRDMFAPLQSARLNAHALRTTGRRQDRRTSRYFSLSDRVRRVRWERARC